MCLLVGLSTQNSEIIFSRANLNRAILKGSVKKSSSVISHLKNSYLNTIAEF